MSALARNDNCKHSQLPVAAGVSLASSARNYSCKHFTFATIAAFCCPLLVAFAQDIISAPTQQPAGQPVATVVEVIVTGSLIPTAEEVGPNPVFILNRDLINK